MAKLGNWTALIGVVLHEGNPVEAIPKRIQDVPVLGLGQFPDLLDGTGAIGDGRSGGRGCGGNHGELLSQDVGELGYIPPRSPGYAARMFSHMSTRSLSSCSGAVNAWRLRTL